MANLTLKILAKDILNTNYLNSTDCAITRALARAGHPELKDEGTDINNTNRERFVSLGDNPSYEKLTDKVIQMYRLKKYGELDKIKNFQFTLKDVNELAYQK